MSTLDAATAHSAGHAGCRAIGRNIQSIRGTACGRLDRVARRCHEDQRRARGTTRAPVLRRRHRCAVIGTVPRTTCRGLQRSSRARRAMPCSTSTASVPSDAAPSPGTDIGQQAVRHAPSGSPTFVVAALRRGYHARTEASSFPGAGAWTRDVQAWPPRIVSDECSGRRITSSPGATARQAGRA